MGRGLFGAMAMFYSVGAAASGGGSSLTPPAAIIGAVPQLNFSDVANTGGYLQNSAAAGTIVTDGAYFDGASWIPKDTGAVMLQMNGALAGFVMYVNTSLTPGTPFTPTMVYQYLGAGSNVDFAPPVGATGGVVVSGGSLPTTGDSLSITKTNIATKNWGAGTYNALAMQASGFTFQTGTSSITSSLAFDQFGKLTQIHVAQAGAAETLYGGSIADDATAKFELKNASSTDALFIPHVLATGSGANYSLWVKGVSGSDSGSNPVMIFDTSVVTVRPCFGFFNNGSLFAQMAADGSWFFSSTPNFLAAGSYQMGSRRAFGATSGTVANAIFEAFGSPGGATTCNYVGMLGYGNSTAANAQNFTASTALIGVQGFTNHRGSATVTGAAGLVAGAGVNTGGGTITNQYGVYVYAQTAGTNNYTLYGAGGLIDNVGVIRAQGSTVPTSGIGLELLHDGTTGKLISFDRGATAYKAMNLLGLTINIAPSNAIKFTVDSTRVTHASCGWSWNTTVVTAAGPTTIGNTDYWLVANPTVTAAATYNLPPSPATGQEHTVTDEKLIAAANNITVSGNGKNITGGTTATTEVIATNGGSRTFRFNGTNWNIVAKV